jgi:hypothetical protein
MRWVHLRAVPLLFLLLASSFVVSPASLAAPRSRCVLFYYGDQPVPQRVLRSYDWIVIQPSSPGAPATRQAAARSGRVRLLAYLSIGEQEEVAPTLAHAVLGRNSVWASWVMDVRDPIYRDYLLQQADALARDFDGLFLDTLDSYQLVLDESEWPSYEAALRSLVQEVRTRLTGKLLVLNRGFEIVDRLDFDGIVVESLFREDQAYQQQLLALLSALRRRGIEVTLIEYTNDARAVRRYWKTVRPLGFGLYVADPLLQTFGRAYCQR